MYYETLRCPFENVHEYLISDGFRHWIRSWVHVYGTHSWTSICLSFTSSCSVDILFQYSFYFHHFSHVLNRQKKKLICRLIFYLQMPWTRDVKIKSLLYKKTRSRQMKSLSTFSIYLTKYRHITMFHNEKSEYTNPSRVYMSTVFSIFTSIYVHYKV